MTGALRAAAHQPFGRVAYLWLCFSVVYLPLEEFLLKWLPGGSTGYVLGRLGFEAALYTALAALVAAHLVRGLALPATPVDRPLLLFLALALASLALSGGSVLAGLVNLRVLVRYVAVFYVVVYLDLGALERRRVLALLLGGAWLQGALGILQHLQGGVSDFWLPSTTALEVGGVSKEFAVLEGGIEQGAVLGTTDHSVSYALFLLCAGTLAAALFLADRGASPARRLARLALVALALVGILFSYTRSCLFALVLTLALLLWIERRSAFVARLFSVGLLLAPLALAGLWLARGSAGEASFAREKEVQVGPLASVAGLFTAEYLETAQSSRLWILREVGGEIVRSAGWLGLGPDEEHARERLLASGGASLHRLLAYKAFEDVYWVALLAYYGFLGLAAFLALLWRLAPAAAAARRRARDPWERAAANTFSTLLLVLVPLSFLAPTLDFRTFAFYFWLLAGMVVTCERSALRPRSAPARACWVPA